MDIVVVVVVSRVDVVAVVVGTETMVVVEVVVQFRVDVMNRFSGHKSPNSVLKSDAEKRSAFYKSFLSIYKFL